jgi:hypothetical protein
MKGTIEFLSSSKDRMMEVVPTFAGLPQTTDAARGLMLLQSGTAQSLAMMNLKPEDRAMVARTAREICASLTVAKPELIALEIEALALHYPAFNRTSQESRVANAHWLEDLGDWPVDLIREACRKWRNSAERYFPTPGQLKALASNELMARRVLADRASEFLKLVENAA